MACDVRIWPGVAWDLIWLTLVLGLGLMLVLGVVLWLWLVRWVPIILHEMAILRLPLVGMANRIGVVVQTTTSRSAKG